VKPSRFYRGVRAVVRAALHVFYRTIEITGIEHLDAGAPTILVCNHGNSIIDPLLVALFEERQASFVARDGLFKIPGFGGILRAVGAIPLQRRSDYAGGAVDNAGAFAACREVLLRGGVIVIFPEGKTHERMRIEPIKTGAARIALDAVTASPGLGLRVVPVGVTYLVRHAFLSDVHVAIGPPIDVATGPLPAEDGVEAVRALTARVEQELRRLAVHIDEAEDERLIAQVTAIVAGIRAGEGLDEGGQSPAERTALVRRVVDAYRWLKDSEPYETALIRERIEKYMAERQRLGLGGERPTLQHRGERRALGQRRRAAFLGLGAPLAAYGLATCLLPYALLRMTLWVLRPSNDRVALFKLLGGAALFGACFAAETAAVAWLYGAIPASLFGASVLPAALFAQRYVTEVRLHRIHLKSVDALLQRARMARLRAEREALARELGELRRRYLAHLEEAAAPPAAP
jgi:glycerol-3-phosphate O-acyltransferase / dihydroxyacetone phosphate acyltransferase